jgi:hypothetical protein
VVGARRPASGFPLANWPRCGRPIGRRSGTALCESWGPLLLTRARLGPRMGAWRAASTRDHGWESSRPA